MVECINSEKESLKVDRGHQFLHFGEPRKIFFFYLVGPLKIGGPLTFIGFYGSWFLIILLAFVDLILDSKEAQMKTRRKVAIK